ncbi:MAG: cache domain-containing protein [Methanomicrobiales archaeon]|nr:cache domain-containing protein [Methanomicrobiales archaeon]
MHCSRLLPILVVALMLAPGCISEPAPPDGTVSAPAAGAVLPAVDPSAALARFTADVNATLQEVDRDVGLAATDLGRTGIAGPEANATLARLAALSPHAADAVTISADGRIAGVMPEEYWPSVGVYVGDESHNRQALSERRPLMSPVFPAAEGFDAVSIRWPVTDGKGTYLGLASVIFEPQLLLADHADRALAGTNFTAWAIDTDGRLIYDRDPGDLVGRTMITDPAFVEYPELVALTRRMIVEPAGSGTYTFTPAGGGPAVRKDAVWGTAGLHGTEWRLLVAREA